MRADLRCCNYSGGCNRLRHQAEPPTLRNIRAIIVIISNQNVVSSRLRPHCSRFALVLARASAARFSADACWELSPMS